MSTTVYYGACESCATKELKRGDEITTCNHYPHRYCSSCGTFGQSDSGYVVDAKLIGKESATITKYRLLEKPTLIPF